MKEAPSGVEARGYSPLKPLIKPGTIAGRFLIALLGRLESRSVMGVNSLVT